MAVAESDKRPSVAVAIPAYNEAEGIVEFVSEIRDSLVPATSRLHLIVVDDASADATVEVLESQGGDGLEVVSAPRNRGHGPTLLAAYRRALDHGTDFVLAVDGDGQFRGTDLRRALVLLQDEAHAVCGVRRFRQDPWFRMIMTRLLRGYVRLAFGVAARDPNCPLRGYESPLLADLLGRLPPDCLIPNLYLTILASRHGAALLEVDVSHRVRRGSSPDGSSWGAARRFPVPWRLVRFSWRALLESRKFRASLPRRLARSPSVAGAPGSTATPPPTRAR